MCCVRYSVICADFTCQSYQQNIFGMFCNIGGALNMIFCGLINFFSGLWNTPQLLYMRPLVCIQSDYIFTPFSHSYMHTAVPTNLTATSITSRAFSLSWQATNLTSGNMSFRIYYQQQNCSSCALQTQEENDRARRSQRISGQEVVPYSTYRVYMTLIYNSNESEPSGTITLTTQLGNNVYMVTFTTLLGTNVYMVTFTTLLGTNVYMVTFTTLLGTNVYMVTFTTLVGTNVYMVTFTTLVGTNVYIRMLYGYISCVGFMKYFINLGSST